MGPYKKHSAQLRSSIGYVMMAKEDTDFFLEQIDMSDGEFAALSSFLYSHTGITLPSTKKNMLISRLLKRLKAVRMKSFSEYYAYLTTAEGRRSELCHAIDMVSTNKTEFFREPSHFQFLKNHVLRELVSIRLGQGKKDIDVWSAGCSSGEEPYTIGMVLQDFLRSQPGFNFAIVATDISHRILDKARYAVYSEADVQALPAEYIGRYLLRGRTKVAITVLFRN